MEVQNTETRKKKKAGFAEHFLKEINNFRSNPSQYADVVEKHIEFIQVNTENGKSSAFYVRENMPKISLIRGEPAFREFIEKLRKMQPLPKLELRQDLAIPIPEDSTQWTSKDYIFKAVNDLKSTIKSTSSYKSFNFHFDVGSPFSENSFVLQLVDDTPFKGSRSRNILNPNFTYLGVSSTKVKNKHCGYFLFAS